MSKLHIFFIDIISFYIVIICSQLAFSDLLQIPPVGFVVYYLSCVGLFAIFGCYMLLTFLPAKNFIFKDPITNKYGFRAHSDKFNIFKRKKR